MRKFKKGDVVEVVDALPDWSIAEGKRYTLKLDESCGFVYIDDPAFQSYKASRFKLVEPEGPVRTVTRLEPVEGKHGIVQLDVHNGQIVVTISPEDGHQPSGDELRSAAMILSQIAEYRDEVTK